METFSLWLNEVMAVQVNLPPIPQGFQRLTHFTSPQIAHSLIGGADFKSPKGLASTTDVFNNNKDVISLIQTGQTGAFTRGAFGTAVVLMDMNPQEYRIRANYTSNLRDVPNNRIVGYYDRQSGRFISNTRYSTNQVMPNNPQQQMPTRGGNSGSGLVPAIVPQNNQQATVDIW